MSLGDHIEYAAHNVGAQDDGSFLPIDEECWLPGKVLSVDEHPVPIDSSEAVQDTVVLIAPDSGEPPFHLTAKLVRRHD